jgi:nitroreductase
VRPVELREALYTTRAMRRVSDKPIPQEVQARILDAAIRAPSGGNSQNWRFLLVDDPAVLSALAPIYRASMDIVWSQFYKERLEAAAANPDDPESQQTMRVKRSADHLTDNFERYPLMLLAFSQFDASGGSIFPAVWNAMLAARGEGVGAALTSAMMLHAKEALEVLGVPDDEGWNMACCVTFGYPTGRWGVAPRVPVEDVSFKNRWGQPLDFEVNGPLWP